MCDIFKQELLRCTILGVPPAVQGSGFPLPRGVRCNPSRGKVPCLRVVPSVSSGFFAAVRLKVLSFRRQTINYPK
jgi:hypothetical protein